MAGTPANSHSQTTEIVHPADESGTRVLSNVEFDKFNDRTRTERTQFKQQSMTKLETSEVEDAITLAMKMYQDRGRDPRQNAYFSRLITDAGFKADEIARLKVTVGEKLQQCADLLSRRTEKDEVK